jgi:hypothetical protein
MINMMIMSQLVTIEDAHLTGFIQIVKVFCDMDIFDLIKERVNGDGKL